MPVDETNTKDLCPNKTICGSCKWSHIPYEKQLQQKLSDINSSFREHGVALSCEEILPAPTTSHYRNRMDFAIDFEGRVGLRQKGKWWRVIDGHHCFISDKRIEELFEACREWTREAGLSYFDRKAHTGLLRYAVIRASDFGETLVTIITSTPSETEEAQVHQALQNLSSRIPETNLVWSIAETVSDVSRGERIVPIHRDPFITEEIGGYKYRIHPFTFFQTNSAGAEVLLKTVLEFASDIQGSTFLDLYCGSGFFTLPLAKKFQNVLGIEIEAEAVERARENASLNGLNVEFVTAKTEEYDWTATKPSLLLVDPPRMGLHDNALLQLKKCAPENIIYVSCNFKAFAREMKLLENEYSVEQIVAVDMFPHTPHVEMVSRLLRK